jgi:hypothetical protein
VDVLQFEVVAVREFNELFSAVIAFFPNLEHTFDLQWFAIFKFEVVTVKRINEMEVER